MRLFLSSRAGAGLLGVLVAACVPPSQIGGARATPSAPGAVWPTAPRAGAPFDTQESRLATRGAEVPSDVSARLNRLSLADVVAVALGNSPQTRQSWAQARMAAATYGSARGGLFPAVTADLTGGPAAAISQNPARVPANRTTTTTSLSLQYVLFDFGGRGGLTAAAHEALFAADLTHNATVQAVLLQAQGAYFVYQATRGLLEAAQAAVLTARTNLEAAQRRHDVGLATIADILQARTALAQSALAEQTAEGNVQAARAQLALAMGLPANAAFETAPDTGAAPIATVAENVDSLIARAAQGRPDVAAARATARAAEERIRAARAAILPSVTLGATTGQAYSNNPALEGHTYGLTFGLSVPLFNGFARNYDLIAARETAAQAAANADQTRLQAIAQLFTSYYALRTATQRIATAAELLSSATQSEEVARGRYAEGVGSILDLLTAQTALSDARAQAVQARWTWYSALAQLARDAGVLGPRGEPNLSLTAVPAGNP